MLRSRLSLAALIGCLSALAVSSLPGQPVSAVPPSTLGATHAVVRIPSHGASATIIRTEAGRSVLLGCGHAYQGADRTKPMVLDVPTDHAAGVSQKVGVFLVDVDYQSDLSLIQVNAGPLAAVAPVAPVGFVPGPHIVSVGYDEMRLPAVQASVSIVQQAPGTTYTIQRPGHGRSGGALLDADAGYLIGVVQGYELTGPRRGMYVSHPSILRFLRSQGTAVRSQRSEPPPLTPDSWPAPLVPTLPRGNVCPPSG